MNEEQVPAGVEELRGRQSNLFSAFEEIAHTFLSSVSGSPRNSKVFASLQNYLDGSVSAGGVSCSRRMVLLAIHDLKEELEAPSALQSKTLAKLEQLQVRPVPQVTFYQDIATAILRMEVIIRSEATQALNEPAAEAAEQLASLGTARPRRRAVAKLRILGRGLAVAACCAGAIMFLRDWYGGQPYSGMPPRLEVSGAEALADIQRRSPDGAHWANSGVRKRIDANACKLGTSPACDQRRSIAIANAFSAAEFVMYTALTEAGVGSVIAMSAPGAYPVREIPHRSSWATSVEANNIARSAVLSETAR